MRRDILELLGSCASSLVPKQGCAGASGVPTSRFEYISPYVPASGVRDGDHSVNRFRRWAGQGAKEA